VLIVDDEPVVRDIGRKILQEFGYSVDTADSGEEAVTLVRRKGGDYGLVLLDLGMPGMGGIECLKLLLKEFPALKVVVSSGSSDCEPEEAIGLGAKALLGKPYRMNDLLNMVNTI
jgi:CheY-like chemotaxis protein